MQLQANKTELNMILINLIVSDILISGAGVPFDVLAAFMKGKEINDEHCQAAAFIHTLLGKPFVNIYILMNTQLIMS